VTGSDGKPEGAQMPGSKAPGGKVPGKEALTPPLPKRFYKDVTVGGEDGAWAILLDGRPVKTPAKHALTVPTKPLAEAIAGEWRAQGERINPHLMPLSKLAITAIDGVAKHTADVAADIVKFAGSDMICYRAEAPEALTVLQGSAWDPILAWARSELGARFNLAVGVMPVHQSPAALEKVAEAVARFTAMALTALHVMTTLTGSALLALAHASGRISAEEAWLKAHVDEDWQISQWGVDVEAAQRRAARQAEMMAASRFLDLLGPEARIKAPPTPKTVT
jgi:chaperone required for assembly of F1-ATPase